MASRKMNFIVKTKRITILVFTTLLFLSCKTNKDIIIENVLGDKTKWVVEQQPGGIVNFQNNTMEIIDNNGCTVWFNNQLNGNINIEYDVTVIDNNGPHDRVSDNNCFWMASDPNSPNDFFKNTSKRAGKFSNYNTLKLYYVGYGGHNNTKTRFRKYDGNFDRPLLPEHDLSDKKFLITANKKTHIQIIVYKNIITFSRDGETVFTINDKNPYKKGYFGFRTVNNHMIIENFKVKGSK